MRIPFLVVIALFSVTGGALAQNAGNGSVPTELGNRANGRDYQPTPNEVAPREKAVGVAPSTAQQQQTNQQLWRTDANLLKSEGLSTKSVPNTGTGH